MTQPISLLRLPDVMARTGLARSTIYAAIQAGTFPASVRIGHRIAAWPSDQVDAWIQAGIAGQASVGPAPRRRKVAG